MYQNSKETSNIFLPPPLIAFAIILCVSFSWPDELELIKEFGEIDNNGKISSYLQFRTEEFTTPENGKIVFSGRLHNGLGTIKVLELPKNIYFILGRSSNGEYVILVIDQKQKRVINPEILFASPDENREPTLLGINLDPEPRWEAPTGGPDPSIFLRPRQRANLPLGSYRMSLNWSDGRFARGDVKQLYSLSILDNTEESQQFGVIYLEEHSGGLHLYPGISEFSNLIIEEGRNTIEFQLEDVYGKSSIYTFSIEGEPLTTLNF